MELVKIREFVALTSQQKIVFLGCWLFRIHMCYFLDKSGYYYFLLLKFFDF